MNVSMGFDLVASSQAIAMQKIINPFIPPQFGGGTPPTISRWFAGSFDNGKAKADKYPKTLPPDFQYEYFTGICNHPKAILTMMLLHGGPHNLNMSSDSSLDPTKQVFTLLGPFVPMQEVVPLTYLMKAPAKMIFNYDGEYSDDINKYNSMSGFVFICIANEFAALGT